MASLGAVGGASAAEPVEAVIKKQVNNEDTKQQNVTVAVPKNIQRNIISRERDDRRKLRHRGEQKPRNMMMATTSAASVTSTEVASAPQPPLTTTNDIGFIPIKFRNDEQSEAGGLDQDHELQPLEVEVGLDRVPTRLSSTELEAGRRQDEEENLQNLVDEVLNNEVDFIVGNSDLS